jgi:hypothetical protein
MAKIKQKVETNLSKAVSAVETASAIKEVPMTEEERQLLAQSEEEQEESPTMEPEQAPGVPPWAILPEGFKLPPPGRKVIFLRFPPHITERTDLGDRWCVVWSLSLQEERLAASRMRGDASRFILEHTKQMIRCVDGKLPNWVADPNKDGRLFNPDIFMDQIGYKGREILMTVYNKLHSLTPEERVDFFATCMVSLDAQPA